MTKTQHTTDKHNGATLPNDLGGPLDLRRCDFTQTGKGPTSAALAASIKDDLRNLAAIHAPDRKGDWPGGRANLAYKNKALSVARELASEALNSEAMAVLDAIIRCHHAEIDSVYGRDIDGDELADILETDAMNFASYTREVVRHHVESDE